MYIVDCDADSVVAYDLESESVVAGYPFAADGDSIRPTEICIDNQGTLYVADNKGYTIYSKSQSSQTFTEMNLIGEDIIEPAGMHYDAANNRILICEYASSNAAIKALDLTNDSVYTILQTNIQNSLPIVVQYVANL